MNEVKLLKIGKRYKFFINNNYKYEGELLGYDVFCVTIKDCKSGKPLMLIKNNILSIQEVMG